MTWTRWASELAAPLLLPAVAVLVNQRLASGLDLGDHPGPGGSTQLMMVAQGGDISHPSQVACRWLMEHLALSPGDAGELLGRLALASAVLGAVLGGRALSGRPGGWGAGLVVAALGFTQLLAMLVGDDMPGMGLGMLGLGMALLGGRLGPRGLPLVVLGVVGVCCGGWVKEAALVLLVPLAAVPFAARTWWGRGTGTLGLGLGFVLGSTVYLQGLGLPWVQERSRALHRARALPEAGLDSLQAGLRAALEVFPEPSLEVALWQLAALALLGALLPGGRQLARAVLLLGVLLGLSFAGTGAGQVAQPRHFLPGLGALFLLAGAGGASLASWLSRPVQQLGGWLVLLPLLAAGVGLDGYDLVHAYGEARIAVGARPPELPPPPRGYSGRYGWFVNEAMLSGTSLRGAPALPGLAQELALPLGTIYLRDGRAGHVQLAALEAGQGLGLLYEPEQCCVDPDSARCAEGLMERIDASGGALVMPTLEDRQRLDRSAAFARRLYAAGDFRLDESGWWMVHRGRGQGPLPDCRPGEWQKIE